MTLDDLVQYVCASAGYVDGDDQAACRQFLLARDRMIYDSALWKDSLVLVPIALDPVNNADHAEGIVMLPEIIARAVAVRTAANSVRVNGLETYFRFDADRFAETGAPFEFAILSPVSFVWRGISAIAFGVNIGDDLNLTVRVTNRDGDIIKNTNLLLNENGLKNIRYLTPAGDRKIVIAGADDAGANGEFSFDTTGFGVWTNANAYTMYFNSTAGAWIIGSPGNIPLYGLLAGTWLGLGSFLPGGLGLAGTLPAPTSSAFPAPARVEIIRVYKTATVSPLSIGYTNGEGALNNVALGTLAPEDTASASYQRLRLFGIPSVATALNVLGKAKYQPLDYGQQEQTLRNSENCLIAFARGDVLRRGGENGAAQLAYQEGAALLQQLKDLEAVQAANNQRIIPDSGYGPDYGGGHYWASSL